MAVSIDLSIYHVPANYSGLGLTRRREHANKITCIGPLCKFIRAYKILYKYTFSVKTRSRREKLLVQYCTNNGVFAGKVLWNSSYYHLRHNC